MYLTPADYALQVRSEIKALLKGASDRKLDTAETAAVKQIRSYLNNRYDVDNIFFIILPWKAEIAFKKDQYVWYKELNQTDDDVLVYKCIADTTAGTLPTNQSFFTQEDPRDSYINTIVADITLFLLHSKDAQKLIPEVRQIRYDDAMDWLKQVGAGKLDADLPQKSDDDETYQPFVRFGGYPREDNRF